MGHKSGKRVSGGIYVCVCETCIMNDKSWPPVRLPGECDYCKISRPDWVRKNWIIPYPPKELLEFFKIKRICHFCFSSFNNTVRVDLGMCWADISIQALHLAFLKVLNHDLRREANLGIWQKSIVTRCINTGEALPIWANLLL